MFYRRFDALKKWPWQGLGPAVLIAALTVRAAAADGDARSEVYDLGNRLELFVDRHRIESMSGSARLALHEPRPAEIALTFDAPWEGPPSAYVTVFRDGDKVRMYYRGYYTPPGLKQPESGRAEVGRNDGLQFACYAESSDGRTFKRPELGLYEFNGSRDNNIILPHRSHNFAPFKDERPGVPDDERYKAVMQKSSDSALSSTLPGNGLVGLFSADGIRWRVAGNRTVQGGTAYDSLNIAFWDPNHNEYRSYSRVFPDQIRGIGWARSADFLTFTDKVPIELGEGPREHFYTNATTLYFRAPHLYLSFPMRFVPSRSGLKGHQGVSDAVFLSSRDGVHFDRTFLQALIRPGRDQLNWGDRNNMPACGLVQTGPDEMSIYYTQHYKYGSAHVRRGVWRLDGIASLHADGTSGELVTKPFRFVGRRLTLNFATSAAGSVQVEVQDDQGKSVPGFALADAPPLFGDKIDAAYEWRTKSDVSPLAGKTVRLKFVLHDADIYSYRFSD